MEKPFVWRNELLARQGKNKTYKVVIPQILVPLTLRKCHDDTMAGQGEGRWLVVQHGQGRRAMGEALRGLPTKKSPYRVHRA